MKNKLRIASLLIITSVFAVACGSTSADNAKADAPKKTNEKQAVTPTDPAKATTAGKSTTPAEPQKQVATASPKFIEGKHYVKISPSMQTDAPAGKVEVIELMWLGCPHCYDLEPIMLKYKKSHPDYVDFKQIPAMLNPSWAADAKTYYLAEILDPSGEKELVPQIFQAIHEQKRRLRDPSSVVRLFKQFGYTEQQISDVQKSMAFQAKLNRAQEIGNASQARSVPVLIINGKYRTSPYIAGGNENLMKILKMLTEKENKG